MSVPTRVKTQPTMPPPPTTPGLAPTTSRGGVPVTTVRPPTTPPLPDLIKNQPLPDPMTDQYNQLLGMYNNALGQLQGYGTNAAAMQQQINQMTLAAGRNPYQKLLMAQYQGDPYADLREQQRRMMQGADPRLSQSFYVGDNSWGGY